MSQFTAAVAGMVVGFVLFGIGMITHDSWTRRCNMRKLLKRHFRRVDDANIKVHSKVFPYRVSVDVHRAMIEWIDANCQVDSQVGIAISERFMTSHGIASFLTREEWFPAALEYNSFDIGEEQPVQVVRDSLWLARRSGAPIALLWTSYSDRVGCNIEALLRIDVAHVAGMDEAFVTAFYDRLEETVRQSGSYRGKVLSLEDQTDYSGNSIGLVVHRLEPIDREHIILPESTLRLLERNLIRFVAQRPELKKLGLPT